MVDKKKTAAVMIVILAVLMNIFFFVKMKPDPEDAHGELCFDIKADHAMEFQVFYKDDMEFQSEQVMSFDYQTPNTEQRIEVPVDGAIHFIRLDFGDTANKTTIRNLYISSGYSKSELELDRVTEPVLTNDIRSIADGGDTVTVLSQDQDPWIVLSIEDVDLGKLYVEGNKSIYLIVSLILCLVFDLFAVYCIRNIEAIFRVPLDIYRDRQMFWNLAKNDLQARFAGSYFGIFWAFVQPLITMILYWFVFQVGLKAGSVSDYPFILFLMSGLVPWFYFSEALGGATNSLLEYSYLVKKVIFNVGILPVIKVASSIFVHLFFVAMLIIACAAYGFTPDIYCIQLIYYIMCMAFFVLGLSYVTSACTAFFRDMSQIVNIGLSIGIWILPIMWNPTTILSGKLIFIFKMNPIYYIIDGFRDALLAKEWFWNKPVWTVYFWIFCVLLYVGGTKMFVKLKVHFSDVL